MASFDGDGVSSGILGLGLRGLTSGHRGPKLSDERAPYAPFVETMGNGNGNGDGDANTTSGGGVADPVFSFAMSRDESRSYIAFGGVPPVQTGEYAVVPIQKVCVSFLVCLFPLLFLLNVTFRRHHYYYAPLPHFLHDKLKDAAIRPTAIVHERRRQQQRH